MKERVKRRVGIVVSIVIAVSMMLPAISITVGQGGGGESISVIISIEETPELAIQIGNIVASMGAVVKEVHSEGVGIIIADIDPSMIARISAIEGVSHVEEEGVRYDFMSLITSNTYMGMDAAQAGGFTGTGIMGEVQDNGIQTSHPDFQIDFIDGTVTAQNHGTATYGIVFAQPSAGAAEGTLPDATSVFLDYADFSQWNSVSRLWAGTFTSGNAGMNGVFQSNSWGYGPMNGQYNTYTNQDDTAANGFPYVLLLFAAGNSNDGVFKGSLSKDAAAKNVLTVGAVWHENTANMGDDDWRSGGTGNSPSQGPAADGRQKPDVVGPFDWIYTTDRTGAAGYSSGDYYNNFGGTSGSTPAVAGIAGQAYEMYISNYFGNNPGGNIPYSSTIKAMIIADAYQYPLAAADRDSQGWGSADAQQIYTLGANNHVIEDGVSISTGATWSRQIYSDGVNPLKVSLVWNDPAAPAGTGTGRALRNNLDLKLITPSATNYYGNNGLYTNLWSSSGTGLNTWTRNANHLDDENNVENIFILNPAVGTYTIEVSARTGDMASSPQLFSMVAAGAQDVISDNPPASSATYSGGSPTGINPITIDWTATDDIGLTQVELFYQYNAGGYVSWADVSNPSAAAGLADSGLWNFNFPNGPGIYDLYTRATDNFPQVEAAPGTPDVTVEYSPTTPFDIPVSVGWNFISFPIDISGLPETVFNDTTLGDGGTDWDVLQWYDPTDPIGDYWKTYNNNYAGTQELLFVDNTMGFWIRITANGDGLLTTGLGGDYSTVAVNINLESGWNLVGFPSATTQRADLTLPGAVSKIAEYDGAQLYRIIERNLNQVWMLEGNAYWVYADFAATWSVAP